MDDLEKNRAPLLYYVKVCASFQSHGWIQLELQSGNAQFGWKSVFFVPCDLEIWWMTLNKDRAILLCSFKLCASFHRYWWIQTRVTVRKCTIWVKIYDFFSCVTSKLDRWPWKTVEHLFYATSSFVHHFLTISVFKLELQSGNTQFGKKKKIFFSCVTLKFDRWPRKRIVHLS